MTERETITSLTNPRVKAIRRLRDRRERERTGLTIVDGVREIGRAIDAEAQIAEAFVDVDHDQGVELLRAVDRLADRGVHITDVSGPVAARLAFGDRSEGLLAVVQIPSQQLADLDPGPDPLIVVLEGLEKPGNLGAIVRTADGAGVNAVIVADARADLWNPNAIRASLGTIFRMPLAAARSDAVRDWLASRGVRIVAARVGDAVPYTEARLTGPVAIVLGSEAAGLSDAWSGPAVEPVSIPMRGIADSLNVSVAAAVLLYEARRQRDRGTVDRAAAVPDIGSLPNS